jgi:hypothetical protein
MSHTWWCHGVKNGATLDHLLVFGWRAAGAERSGGDPLPRLFGWGVAEAERVPLPREYSLNMQVHSVPQNLRKGAGPLRFLHSHLPPYLSSLAPGAHDGGGARLGPASESMAGGARPPARPRRSSRAAGGRDASSRSRADLEPADLVAAAAPAAAIAQGGAPAAAAVGAESSPDTN